MTDDLAALFALHQAQTEFLVAAYDAAPHSTRKAALLGEYRCRQRCGLLVAWQAPGPIRLARLRPYKLSAGKNQAKSTPSARAKNTLDGDRHWRSRVLVLDDLAGWPGLALDLNCDHYAGHILASELLAEIAEARPGVPVRRVVPR